MEVSTCHIVCLGSSSNFFDQVVPTFFLSYCLSTDPKFENLQQNLEHPLSLQALSIIMNWAWRKSLLCLKEDCLAFVNVTRITPLSILAKQSARRWWQGLLVLVGCLDINISDGGQFPQLWIWALGYHGTEILFSTYIFLQALAPSNLGRG